MELNSSVAAVITGGASGLGEATARALAAKGVKVALLDMNKTKGEAIAAELGGVFCEANVTDEASVVAAFEKARAAHGQERILVNCAGTGNAIKTASRDKKTGETRRFPTDAFNFIIQINLVGTFRCIAISAQGMLSLDPLEGGERGAIVNTASVAAQDGQIGQAAYTASKAGINGLTLVVARDLAQEGIRCNTIMPGLFNTPLLGAAPENMKQALGAQVPFPPRLGNPPEYASLALQMITNPYFNGECVRLDGAIQMMAPSKRTHSPLKQGLVIIYACIQVERGGLMPVAVARQHLAARAGPALIVLQRMREVAQASAATRSCRPVQHPAARCRAGEHEAGARRTGTVPRRVSANPPEYASLALQMITNPYFNGECVRLDGAIEDGAALVAPMRDARSTKCSVSSSIARPFRPAGG